MNLFYASTAYHVLLCYIIGLSDCEGQNNVLLLIGNLAAGKTHTLFQKLFPEVFSKVILLESYPDHNNIKRLLVKKTNLKKIKDIVDDLMPIARFYYTCDWKVEAMYISHLLQETGTEFHYYDDGMGTYIGNYKQCRSSVEKAFSQLFYGKWRTVIEAEGHLNKNAHMHTILPELLPSVYDKDMKYKIDPTNLIKGLKTENFPQELREYVNVPVEMLVALPTVDEINDAFITMMTQLISEADRHNTVVGIKKHPRTADDDPIIQQLNVTRRVVELPAAYPIEMYYLLLGKSLKKVVGFTSTAMMTAKILYPEIDVVVPYTQKSVVADKTAPDVFKLFSKMGIRLEELPD